MTRDDLLSMQAECRAAMLELARLFPACFHADGRPIVAELRLPEYEQRATPAALKEQQ